MWKFNQLNEDCGGRNAEFRINRSRADGSAPLNRFRQAGSDDTCGVMVNRFNKIDTEF